MTPKLNDPEIQLLLELYPTKEDPYGKLKLEKNRVKANDILKQI